MAPERARAVHRQTGPAHAEVLDAWLTADAHRPDEIWTNTEGDSADWSAPHCPVELAYDTADQGLPTGVRVVVREGSRRLMFEAAAYEVLLRVASDRKTQQHELAGQVLFEGLPLPGATVRLDRSELDATTSTDRAGGFRLPPLDQGAYQLKIAVEGAVLTIPPIALG
ncbi:MAG: carboxypeptidase-like regulatory domain-containing protein [Chloroflexota bacterium]